MESLQNHILNLKRSTEAHQKPWKYNNKAWVTTAQSPWIIQHLAYVKVGTKQRLPRLQFVQVVGNIADNAVKPGNALQGLLIQENRKNLIVAPDDLAVYTRLKRGDVLQRQAIPLAADFSEVYLHAPYPFTDTVSCRLAQILHIDQCAFPKDFCVHLCQAAKWINSNGASTWDLFLNFSL